MQLYNYIIIHFINLLELDESVRKSINVNAVDADDLNAANNPDLFLFRDADCPRGTESDPIVEECIPIEPKYRPRRHYDVDTKRCVPDTPILESKNVSK